MSLTSRVFGLFSTTETSDSPASLASSSPPSAQNVGHATTTVSPVNEGIGAQYGLSQSSAMIEEEEEPRPPYLHVCLAIVCFAHAHVLGDCVEANHWCCYGYRQCWLEAPVAHAATCSCTR